MRSRRQELYSFAKLELISAHQTFANVRRRGGIVEFHGALL
jgi:hypothetical protein